MVIKKYYGENIKALLQQAKRDLGDEVIILSQKRLAKGRLELTVGMDSPQEFQALDHDVLGEDIGDIKQMLFTLVEGREVTRLGKAAVFVYRELKRKGMSGTKAYQVVRELTKGVPPEELLKSDVLKKELQRFLFSRIERIQPFTGEKMCVALLGRTGVGKTTTLAKLASMERFINKRRTAIISLDAWKVGSHEELDRIGKLLDMPIGVAYEREHITSLYNRYKDVDTLFIDTPGKGINDKYIQERLFDLMTLCPATQFHLLLSPNYRREVLLKDMEEYSRLALKSLIITKLDETESIGGLMDAILTHSIPLSYMTTGQDIPNDILPANKGLLFDMMMEA